MPTRTFRGIRPDDLHGRYLMKFSNGGALTEEKLRDIDEFLSEVRRYGAKTLLRFAYELRPRTIPADPGALQDKAMPIAHRLTLDAALPAAVTPGRYTVGLWLPDAAESIRNRSEYAVRLANDIEWRDGVNVIAVLSVV